MIVRPNRAPLIIVALVFAAFFAYLLAVPAAAAPESDLVVALSLDPAILWPFLVAAGLLALKLVLGVAGAVRDGTLDARQLPAILRTNVLPYLIPLAAMAALSLVMPLVKAVYLASVALYVAKLLADLKDAVVTFYGLIKPPETSA